MGDPNRAEMRDAEEDGLVPSTGVGNNGDSSNSVLIDIPNTKRDCRFLSTFLTAYRPFMSVRNLTPKDFAPFMTPTLPIESDTHSTKEDSNCNREGTSWSADDVGTSSVVIELLDNEEKHDINGMLTSIPDSKEDHHWTSLVEELMAPLAEPTRRLQPIIFRVPDNIRNIDPPAYTPQFVAIGPYHRGRLPNSDLVTSIQSYKSRCLRFLLRRNGRSDAEARELLRSCAHKVEKMKPLIRSCYSSDNPGWNDDQGLEDNGGLVKVMLLDGCFLITRLLRTISRGRNAMDDECEGPLLGMRWTWTLVEYDLLKLENLIPFFVLESLFELLKTPEDDGIELVNLALDLFKQIRPGETEDFRSGNKHLGRDKYHHLLHLFYLSRLPAAAEEIPELKCNLDPKYSHDPKDDYKTHDPKYSHEWIPSATELRRAGVVFEANDEEKTSFLDVKFENGYGVMQIPSLRLSDYSNSILRNLIAFEQCYPYTGSQITTYAAFMDCLVDTPEDATLLGASGILVNRLSTDEAAADLFNGITNEVHYALDRNYLHDMFVEVNKYHQLTWNRHRALLMRDYFSSPWSAISVVAAILVILLTLLQTFYSLYGYYHTYT